MNEDYELISNYVVKSKENFLMASLITEKMTYICAARRKFILETILNHLILHFEEKNYIIEHDSGDFQYSFIKLYKPSWVNLEVHIQMEAQSANCKDWCYGIKKTNDKVPFLGDLLKIQEISDNQLYFEVKKHSKLSKSSSWWLCYNYYLQKYRSFNNEI